jgi:hypothetical protein
MVTVIVITLPVIAPALGEAVTDTTVTGVVIE